MRLLKKLVFVCSFTLTFNIVSSQESITADATIFQNFNTFFNKEIKYQGVKGDWIFGLNEITAYHKFDYNNDGFNDLLIEFNAEPIDEGNYTNYYAVLFKNENNESYQLIDYIETVDLQFFDFDSQLVIFKNKNSQKKVTYKLVDLKFIAI